MAGSLPASRAPSSNASKRASIFSAGAPTVMMPSASAPVLLAVSGPAVATYTGGGLSGIVHSRMVSIWKYLPAFVFADELPGEELADDLDRLRTSERMRSRVSGQ